MRKNLPVLSALCAFTVAVWGGNGHWLRVVSEDTGEPLPFSIIELDNGKFLTTDTNGLINLAVVAPKGKPLAVTSFYHKKKNLNLEEPDVPDTVTIRLKPSFMSLNEVRVRPLKKDKDIFRGKYSVLKPEFIDGKFINKGEVPEKWYIEGVRINAKKNKLNVLKAFGVNVVPSDTMPQQFVFRLSIYDVSGKKPDDPRNLPTPVVEPIYVLMDKDSITPQGFRFELPEPIDLPSRAVICVSYPTIDILDRHHVIDFVSSDTGDFFLYGNPYYLYPRNIIGLRLTYSPYFWEYTQYSLPKE